MRPAVLLALASLLPAPARLQEQPRQPEMLPGGVREANALYPCAPSASYHTTSPDMPSTKSRFVTP